MSVLKWYETRWSIEEFFRVLKTGTRIEDRRLDDAEDLRKCLAFDAITAWRVFDLDRAARETPDRPADEIMSRDEIFMLYLGLNDYGVIRCRAPPDLYPRPPNLRHRSRSICRLHPIQTTANARYRKTLDRNDIPHARHCRTPTDEKGRNAPRNSPMISASTVR